MVMDWLRSAYTVPMVFRVGDDPILVKWRRALPEALPFPDFHVFGSANWDERACKAGDLGEQPGQRVWTTGKVVTDPSGQNIGTQPRRWYQEGLTPGEQGALFNADCQCVDCLVSNPVYWNGSFVPDRIKMTYFQSGSPFCGIGFQTAILTRVLGRSTWYFEKLRPNLCYYWHQAELDRTGTNVGDWSLVSSWRSFVTSIGPQTLTLVAHSTSPFHMTFFTPAYQTAYWTSPVTVQLEPA